VSVPVVPPVLVSPAVVSLVLVSVAVPVAVSLLFVVVGAVGLVVEPVIDSPTPSVVALSPESPVVGTNSVVLVDDPAPSVPVELALALSDPPPESPQPATSKISAVHGQSGVRSEFRGHPMF